MSESRSWRTNPAPEPANFRSPSWQHGQGNGASVGWSSECCQRRREYASAGRSKNASRTGVRGEGGLIRPDHPNSAFQFDQRACFPVQLRTLDRRRPPIPRRHRKAHHLLHAIARNPKMTCRLARTHPVPHGETDLQIQFHGENAPALPADRKGISGRVLLRRQRDYPAATVADSFTAVLIHESLRGGTPPRR